MRSLVLIPVAAACALLGACGASDNEPGPGGVSVGEARALDEAAEMLEQQRLPEEALDDPETTPGASEADQEGTNDTDEANTDPS